MTKQYQSNPELYYHHQPETWSVEKCEKAIKHLAKDGLGTPYPQKGMLPYIKSGPMAYNGGTSKFEKWYQGEVFALPILPSNFEWKYISTWCWKIVKIA